MKIRQINFRMSEKMYKQIQEYSNEWGITMSEIVRIATIEWITRNR